METALNEIYLDNGATTKPSKGVVAKMREVLEAAYGNPSSLHRKGQEAERYVKEARETLAQVLQADPVSVYFTSGGTECSNTAILGAASSSERRGKHILTLRGEHPATSEPLKYLQEQGWEIEYIGTDEQGRADSEDFRCKLREDTVLVTCLQVNNETGVIQPVQEMGGILRECAPHTLFHVDAVQSFAKMEIFPRKWNIDLLSSSAHKIHGPKGVGGLYIRRDLHIPSFIRGGGQERQFRSGTENVPGIAGFGQAAKEAWDERRRRQESMQCCKLYLYEQLRKSIDGITHNGPEPREGAAHILNLRIKGVRSEVLLHALEDYGIYVSSGSACASNKPDVKSPALGALGMSAEAIDESVRVSFSKDSTLDEMDRVVKACTEIIPMLRRFTPKGRR